MKETQEKIPGFLLQPDLVLVITAILGVNKQINDIFHFLYNCALKKINEIFLNREIRKRERKRK